MRDLGERGGQHGPRLAATPECANRRAGERVAELSAIIERLPAGDGSCLYPVWMSKPIEALGPPPTRPHWPPAVVCESMHDSHASDHTPHSWRVVGVGLDARVAVAPVLRRDPATRFVAAARGAVASALAC